jgi:phage terminase large subunit-like protein
VSLDAIDLVRRVTASMYPEEDPEVAKYEWKWCGNPECDGGPHEGWPHKHARQKQIAPDWLWIIWVILAGRGFGKTRSGAEFVKKKALELPGSRGFIAAPTYADVRDTCVEGESGLIAITPPKLIKAYNRSLGEVVFTNESRIKMFSGDEPERFRGPQHHYGWFDELAAFRYVKEAWDQAMFGLRLGEHPQAVVTTTPKPIKLIRELLERHETTHVTRGSTFENRVNLAASALEEFRKMEGTRLGRQELHAEILTDVPGAIATLDQLDVARVHEYPPLSRRIVCVDPAVTNTEDSDETGITVQGRSGEHVYMLADLSCKDDVDKWALLAVGTAVHWECGMVLYESNQGGDSIAVVLKTALKKFNEQSGVHHVLTIKAVPAKLSKYDRALPLQQAIQQGTYHIVGVASALEEQLTTWLPEDEKGRKMPSPNNMDSAVHSYRELMGIGGMGKTHGNQIANARLG